MDVLFSKSGSSGNASVVSDGKTLIQFDAGIKPEIVNKGIGYRISEVSGIIITHVHSDRPYFSCEGFSQAWGKDIRIRQNSQYSANFRL